MTDTINGVDPSPAGGVAQGIAGLRAEGITVTFGGIKALSGVDIEVSPGKITGLIGPNGAGKSTLLGSISGFLHPERGTVTMGGRDVSALTPEVRARLGLARTFQLPELFGDMTVRDHLVIAHRAHHERGRLYSDVYSGRAFAKPSEREVESVATIMDLLGIRAMAGRNVLSLSLGASRLVEVGRALATSPLVLLADEPSSGLDRRETALLGEALQTVVSERRVGVLLIEHDVDLVLRLSSRVSVLQFGVIIAEGTPEVIRASEKVQAAYLGNSSAESEEHHGRRTGSVVVSEPATAGRPSPAGGVDPLLDVELLSVRYGPAQALDSVSLSVAPGVAVAVLGANGAGKSTLSRALSGLVPAYSGRVSFDGRDVTNKPSYEIRRLGLAYLPEGRGIFPGLSVRENLRMAVQMIERVDRETAIERAIEFFPVLGARGRQLAGSMSGGEQQMLSLARALAVTPRLVIGDELSLGLAPLVIDSVFEGLARAKAEGISIIVIEQFIHRALALCDYAYILRRGKVCWAGPSADAEAGAAEYYLGSET